MCRPACLCQPLLGNTLIEQWLKWELSWEMHQFTTRWLGQPNLWHRLPHKATCMPNQITPKKSGGWPKIYYSILITVWAEFEFMTIIIYQMHWLGTWHNSSFLLTPHRHCCLGGVVWAHNAMICPRPCVSCKAQTGICPKGDCLYRQHKKPCYIFAISLD